MAIRLCLLDMDGTLLGRSQVAISMRNMEAIQSALSRGIHIVPCTGRVYNMLPPQLLSQRGIRYCITSHGARLYDREANTSLYTDIIPAKVSSELLASLSGLSLYNEIAANGTIYFEHAIAENMRAQPVPEHHIWYVRDQCYTAVQDPAAHFLKNNIGIEKLNLYGIPAPMQQQVYDTINNAGCIAHTRPGAGPDVECYHNTLDKRKAVETLLQTLSIDKSEVLAIGDSKTDLPIIELAGIGVAMGNAPAEIKRAADAVTADNTEDGVAIALEKYL